MKDPRLSEIAWRLEWAAGGEWSLSLKPADCAYLLAEIRRPPSRRRVNRPDGPRK